VTIEANDVRVAYVPSLTRDLVVPAIIKLRTKHRDLEVHALQGRTQDVLKRVAGRDVDGFNADVGLGFYEGAYSTDVRAEHLFQRRVSLIVRAKNPPFRERKISLDSLKGKPMALLSESLKAGELVREFLSKNRVAPVIAFQADSIHAVLSYVRATNSVALVPEPHDSDAEGLRVVELSPSPPPINIHVFFPRRRSVSSCIDDFVAEVKRLAPASGTRSSRAPGSSRR
jgi:LysR family transcriptional regulator, cyn operon transcriptional activator